MASPPPRMGRDLRDAECVGGCEEERVEQSFGSHGQPSHRPDTASRQSRAEGGVVIDCAAGTTSSAQRKRDCSACRAEPERAATSSTGTVNGGVMFQQHASRRQAVRQRGALPNATPAPTSGRMSRMGRRSTCRASEQPPPVAVRDGGQSLRWRRQRSHRQRRHHQARHGRSSIASSRGQHIGKASRSDRPTLRGRGARRARPPSRPRSSTPKPTTASSTTRSSTSTQNPLSTFSIDVDTASYSNVRRFLDAGPAAAEGCGADRGAGQLLPVRLRRRRRRSEEPFAAHVEVGGVPVDSRSIGSCASASRARRSPQTSGRRATSCS